MRFVISFFPIFCLIVGELKGDSAESNQMRTQSGSAYMWQINHLTLSFLVNASCDLTEGFCDSFCCEDDDCDEWQKKTFECSNSGQSDQTCQRSLSHFDCRCHDPGNKPEWFPLLCTEYGNPVYLGKFHEIPKTIHTLPEFNNVVKRKSLTLFKYSLKHGKNADYGRLYNDHYRYGSPVKTYFPGYEPYKFPVINTLMTKRSIPNSNQACESITEQFRINGYSSCMTRVSKKLCESGHLLGMLPHLIRDEFSTNYTNAPFILRSLNFLEGCKIDTTVNCVSLAVNPSKIGQKTVTAFMMHQNKNCENGVDKYKTYWENGTCHNVLVGVQRVFSVNGSDIYKIVTEYSIGNVRISDDFMLPYQSSVYIKQTFNTTYLDLFRSGRTIVSQPYRHESYRNYGYLMDDPLNVGYKNNDTSAWEKGMLAIFKNGGYCNDTIPITFGFNYISRCYVSEKFSSCEHLRNYTEKSFDDLIRGHFLAPYSRLKNSSDEAVPLLRSYTSSEWSRTSNGSLCLIHVDQEVFIQYETIFTGKGNSVYRIIGSRVDRRLRNVTLDKLEAFLTSRVVFARVQSGEKRSKFWAKSLSDEKSENAWLKILNAFEGVEDEENIFWSTLFVVGTLIVLTRAKLDVFDGNFFFLSSLFSFWNIRIVPG